MSTVPTSPLCLLYTLCCIFLPVTLFCRPEYSAELEQLMSTKLEVKGVQDHQIIDCNTYRFNEKMLYENFNTIRLYEDNAYQFAVSFFYFDDDEIINAGNISQRRYKVSVPTSGNGNFIVNAVYYRDEILMVSTLAMGKAGTRDSLHIQLFDDDDLLLAEAIFPFEIQSNEEDATTTAFLPMEMHYQPLYLTLEDIDNPNNRIERQLLPFFPDTINVNARDVFNLYTEIEQEVYLDGNAYVLVADHEKDYGYVANFNWEGQGLQYKPASENKLKSYLTVVPGRGGTVTSPQVDISKLLAQNLQKAGLQFKGERVKQEYRFVMPKENVKKVYSDSYLKKNTRLSSQRLSHQAIRSILDQNKTKVESQLKTSDIKLIPYLQMNKSMLLKMQQPQLKVNESSPQQNKVITTKPNTQISRTRVHPSKIEKQKVDTQLPEKPATNYAVTHIRVVPEAIAPAKNPYYTLSIEIHRETDVMSYQTYLLTFRVIE
ncbi:MAG: hypothetical protein R2824_22185 [Saprospiraceae bacterium]|nr:hypothetical protein [Lewinella sp.]